MVTPLRLIRYATRNHSLALTIIHMKRLPVSLLTSLLLLVAIVPSYADRTIRLSTDKTDWVMRVKDNGRLYQCYLGERLQADIDRLPTLGEQYPSSGEGDYFEPALFVTHADGNPGTVLTVKNVSEQAIEGGTEAIISLQDEVYPLSVTLHCLAYTKENVFKVWSEITHSEKKPIRLSRYASLMLRFKRSAYYLTEYSSDWAQEAQPGNEQLHPGKKILDSQLGSRAAMFMEPFFKLGLDRPAEENCGDVLLGTLGWTGNFRFTFEIDNEGVLRLIPSINPYASAYTLKPGTTFTTPEFIFTLSNNGCGAASRNLHRWARNYQLCNGKSDRLTLLNNWESTYFNFTQEKLGQLMHEAADLGVDMFLLDDGWFGNKYPRSSDRSGLGDWQANQKKLPGGIPALVDSAQAAGVEFGIWVEPEMVNPLSELYEKHRDWVIMYPNRKPYYYRKQLVLDLSNPRVQDFVYSVLDGILKENPRIKYFKWDCNSPITNVYSPYLGKEQEKLYIDHVRGFYEVVKRMHREHPDVSMMLCSGGAGRCDYEALKYFTEFWCSDNTDPIERLYIQWGFSQFFPAKAMCAHVTDWNTRATVKFRTDVAFMCKFGFDFNVSRLRDNEKAFCREAVATYKRLKPVILDGDLYRLVAPYGNNHMALMYVDSDEANHALVFAYDIHPRYGEHLLPVRLQGLRSDRRYRVHEVNLMPGAKSRLSQNEQVLSGDYLQKVGLNLFTTGDMQSRVIELIAE